MRRRTCNVPVSPQTQTPPMAQGDFAAMAAQIGETVTATLMSRIQEITQEAVAGQLTQKLPTLQVLEQQVLPQQVQTKHPNFHDLSPEAKHLSDFRKCNPYTFDESLKDLTKAEMWLSFIEAIFRYMKCLEDQKLQCAIFVQTHNAEIQWQSMKRSIVTNGGLVTWDQFKE